MVLLSLDWARNAPYSLDKVRVREGAVGPSFSQTATSRVPGYGGDLQNEKAKTKASDPIQRRIAKGNERPPDHQARRRSRNETLSQVAQGERVIGQHEENAVDEESQESPTSKTCSSYEKKPARTKNYQKTETASKTGANKKTYP